MSNEKFTDTWENLPDPRGIAHEPLCDIVIDEGFWIHRDKPYKHLLNPKQPWEQLLGESLGAEARSLAEHRGGNSNKKAILQDIADKLREQVDACLSQPRVLMFDLYKANSDKRLFTPWLLVLPAGALFRIKSIGRRKKFAVSCYFRYQPGRKPQTWCFDECEMLVLAFTKGTGRDNRSTPGKNDTFGPENHTTIRPNQEGKNVQFATPKSWGFGSDSSLGTWAKVSIPPWKTVTTPAGSPRFSLDERLPPLNDEDVS